MNIITLKYYLACKKGKFNNNIYFIVIHMGDSKLIPHKILIKTFLKLRLNLKLRDEIRKRRLF